MINKMEFINYACLYAVRAHKNQKRKGKNVPYILHPLEVMNILYRMGANEELLVAGVLHDVVEDTDATIQDIRENFGEKVAELVLAHTENKILPWEKRKLIACKSLLSASKEVQMLVLADKLSNAREMLRDLEEVGDKLWERFNRSKEKQSWYYHLGVECLADMSKCKHTNWAYQEFVETVNKVFR